MINSLSIVFSTAHLRKECWAKRTQVKQDVEKQQISFFKSMLEFDKETVIVTKYVSICRTVPFGNLILSYSLEEDCWEVLRPANPSVLGVSLHG